MEHLSVERGGGCVVEHGRSLHVADHHPHLRDPLTRCITRVRVIPDVFGLGNLPNGQRLAATAQGKFLPQPGAALIRDSEGTILGAAGASGATGEEDEASCVYGIEQAGLQPDAAE